MIGFDIDIKNTLKRTQDALSGNSLVKYTKSFADQPARVLGAAAERYGFPSAGKAIKSGRIDDIVSAVGSDAIGLLAKEGTRQVNKAIDAAAGKFLEVFQALDGGDPPPAGDVLLILGDFPFMVGTAAHQSIKRTNNYRWAQQDRLLREPSQQFVGKGDERIELEGYLLPHYTGGSAAMDTLRGLAAAGGPLDLIDHFGAVLGRFVVSSIQETGTELDRAGQARRIEFSVSLLSYGEDEAAATLASVFSASRQGIQPDINAAGTAAA